MSRASAEASEQHACRRRAGPLLLRPPPACARRCWRRRAAAQPTRPPPPPPRLPAAAPTRAAAWTAAAHQWRPLASTLNTFWRCCSRPRATLTNSTTGGNLLLLRNLLSLEGCRVCVCAPAHCGRSGGGARLPALHLPAVRPTAARSHPLLSAGRLPLVPPHVQAEQPHEPAAVAVGRRPQAGGRQRQQGGQRWLLRDQLSRLDSDACRAPLQAHTLPSSIDPPCVFLYLCAASMCTALLA